MPLLGALHLFVTLTGGLPVGDWFSCCGPSWPGASWVALHWFRQLPHLVAPGWRVQPCFLCARQADGTLCHLRRCLPGPSLSSSPLVGRTQGGEMGLALQLPVGPPGSKWLQEAVVTLTELHVHPLASPGTAGGEKVHAVCPGYLWPGCLPGPEPYRPMC